MKDLEGKTALVTGASRGLGFALAQRLGARGAEVIALARTVGGLEELDDAIREAGGPGATLTPLDLSDDSGLERLGAAIHSRWGRLDFLIHAAVQAPPLSPADHADAKEFDKAMAVNGRAVWQLIRCMAPLLRAAPAGCAVFFDDVHNCGPYHGVYAASKAAGRAMSAAWAEETQRFPLTVLHLCPPAMPTALRARFRPSEGREGLTDPGAAADALLPDILP